MWLSESHRAPGYRFQYHVPPTPSPASNARTDSPRPRSRYSMYSPAIPAPITAASTSGAPGASPLRATSAAAPRGRVPVDGLSVMDLPPMSTGRSAELTPFDGEARRPAFSLTRGWADCRASRSERFGSAIAGPKGRGSNT